MNFPEHLTIELDAQDHADLSAARQAFIASMSGLTPKQQLDRATVIAGGLREADPYSRALAQQVVDGAKLRDRIEASQVEVKELEQELRRVGNGPGVNPVWRGEKLSRKDDLVQSIGHDHARLLALHEDTFDSAQRKAAVHFRAQRVRAAKSRALNEAVARMEAKFEAEDLDRLAEAITRARRMTSGRKSGRNAEEA